MSLDQPSSFVKHQTITRDAFLGGRLTLSQPRDGFRAGFDSVVLGAAVTKGRARLLDLGAGVGTAGLVALRLGCANSALLAERNEESAALARDNVDLNGFAGAAGVAEVDILGRAAEREAAGLTPNSFDTVIANPPFFDAGRGTLAPDSGRARARHMDEGGMEAWARCAAGCASGGGEFIIVYPATGLALVLEAMASRFGALTVLPMSPRPGQAASRILVRGIKGSRAPLTLLSSRALHGEEGRNFAPEFDAIFRGEAVLDW